MKDLKNSMLNQLLYFMQDLHITNKESDFKHTVLYGPPGTGKTEIAKIIGTMYSKIGILKNNVFKKVTRNDLVAGYLGQTAIKTKKVIDECLGGVLFIDEAYSLANNYQEDGYSKECIDTLCEALSDHKDDLMVIIAGYEEDLNESFFKANKGMESRFIWRFNIEQYNTHDLMEIFKKKINETDWVLEHDIVNIKWFDKHKQDFKNYGRDMELLFSYLKIAHSRRIYGKDASLRKHISTEDLDAGYDMFMKNKKKENKMSKMLESIYI
jgi:SpoVK/Ycf46/Vps4 family AAA+-type ATPase